MHQIVFASIVLKFGEKIHSPSYRAILITWMRAFDWLIHQSSQSTPGGFEFLSDGGSEQKLMTRWLLLHR